MLAVDEGSGEAGEAGSLRRHLPARPPFRAPAGHEPSTTSEGEAMQRRVRRVVGVAAAVTLVVAAGCGGDDDGQSAAEKTEYCDAVTAIETDPGPEIDFATATPEEMAAATKEYATETFRPMADRAIAAAPESLAEDYAVLDRALTQVEQTGDFEGAFSSEEVDGGGGEHPRVRPEELRLGEGRRQGGRLQVRGRAPHDRRRDRVLRAGERGQGAARDRASSARTTA